MSALTPPRADLRGGNQSADSFATSRRIRAPPATLCKLFAERSRAIQSGQRADPARDVEFTHIDFDPGCSRRFRILSDRVFETCLCFQSVDVSLRCVKPRDQMATKDQGGPRQIIPTNARLELLNHPALRSDFALLRPRG